MFNIKNLTHHLDSNEKIVAFFRPSRRAYIHHYILYGILFLVSLFFSGYKEIGGAYFILWDFINLISLIFLIYTIIMLIRLEYRIWSRKYALTDERILYSRGIFSEKFKSSTYNRITDVGFHQTLWDKLMKTGTITVNTAGTNTYEIRYRKIYNPLKIKKIINDYQTTKNNPK